MMRNILKKRDKKRINIDLKELDEFYGKTIVSLPLESRIHYCQNCIACGQIDISLTRNKSDIERIQTRIRSAELELKKISEK